LSGKKSSQVEDVALCVLPVEGFVRVVCSLRDSTRGKDEDDGGSLRAAKNTHRFYLLVQVAWNAQKHSVTIFFCCIAN